MNECFFPVVQGDKRRDSDDHMCGSEIVLVNLACIFLSGSVLVASD
jgi:hypothetical protein